MSSARKRSAIAKAAQEADFQRQRAILAEHHTSVMETFAKAAATKADALQAQLDALMLEYCPEEMTPEQMANWARRQRPASDEMQADVAKALMGSNEKVSGAGTASAGLPGYAGDKGE